MSQLKRYNLLLDLVDDEILIKEYEDYHKSIWPEIAESIKAAGILNMEIYRVGNRLSMIMEVNEDFSFEQKSISDSNNEKVQEWENLMWKYQQALPIAKVGEKWILAEKIFTLKTI
jgi:L-rhamnose mutarotase